MISARRARGYVNAMGPEANQVVRGAGGSRLCSACALASFAQHFGYLEPNLEIGIVGQWLDQGTAVAQAQVPERANRFPADPGVVVGEQMLEQGSEPLVLCVGGGVDRRASHQPGRVGPASGDGTLTGIGVT